MIFFRVSLVLVRVEVESRFTWKILFGGELFICDLFRVLCLIYIVSMCNKIECILNNMTLREYFMKKNIIMMKLIFHYFEIRYTKMYFCFCFR